MKLCTGNAQRCGLLDHWAWPISHGLPGGIASTTGSVTDARDGTLKSKEPHSRSVRVVAAMNERCVVMRRGADELVSTASPRVRRGRSRGAAYSMVPGLPPPRRVEHAFPHQV